MKLNLKKFYISYLVSLAISFAIGLTIFLTYFFVNEKTMYAAINGTSISAVVLLSVGGLMFVANEGFFDIFAYGAKQVGSSIFSKRANENNDFAGYKEQGKIKRESKPKIFVPILLSGAIFLIAMVVLRLVEFGH
ncbi:MAG: DUF3899 domain-containing protein [Bacilli bacterium]|nr:DUF3899 domain-containing protein [Bacilli bacterium]